MNPMEAASYSWNLNKNKSMASRILHTIGASVSGVFSCYKINIQEIESLVRENSSYKQSYFYRSLKRRNVAIDVSITTPKLVIPKGYEKHQRVAIDGGIGSGKSHFINALKGKSFDDDTLTSKFYELNDNIVLCEQAHSKSSEGYYNEPQRYDDYDSVVITIKCPNISELDRDFMQIAKDSGKPYLVVMTNINRLLDHHDKHHPVSKEDKPMRDKKLIERQCNTIKNELKKQKLMPSNGKILVVDNEHSSDFDFKEASNLIISKDFNVNDSD